MSVIVTSANGDSRKNRAGRSTPVRSVFQLLKPNVKNDSLLKLFSQRPTPNPFSRPVISISTMLWGVYHLPVWRKNFERTDTTVNATTISTANFAKFGRAAMSTKSPIAVATTMTEKYFDNCKI